jgi:hypothetical protein
LHQSHAAGSVDLHESVESLVADHAEWRGEVDSSVRHHMIELAEPSVHRTDQLCGGCGRALVVRESSHLRSRGRFAQPFASEVGASL